MVAEIEEKKITVQIEVVNIKEVPNLITVIQRMMKDLSEEIAVQVARQGEVDLDPGPGPQVEAAAEEELPEVEAVRGLQVDQVQEIHTPATIHTTTTIQVKVPTIVSQVVVVDHMATVATVHLAHLHTGDLIQDHLLRQ
jgi:hypothetical protein